MADTQPYAALAEAALAARIALSSGTAAEWTAANPVLLKGEIGVVAETSPVQFKIGDGTTAWADLPWAHAAALSQLADDASHRLLTDADRTRWNDSASRLDTLLAEPLILEGTLPGMLDA